MLTHISSKNIVFHNVVDNTIGILTLSIVCGIWTHFGHFSIIPR